MAEEKDYLFFYSGQTQEVEGKTIRFSGVWDPDPGVEVEIVDVFQAILDSKRSEFGCEVALTSFNKV